MKPYSVIYFLAASFITSCTDDFNSLTQQDSKLESEDLNEKVIVQKRNPSLPEVVTKTLVFDENRLRNGEQEGASDKFLGYGYKLFDGNYIPSDFDNFTHSILDIEAIKRYDESYIDVKYPNWNNQSSFAYSDFSDYTHFSSISKTVTSGFSLNLGFFSIGKKKKTVETFRTYINDTKEQVYGEMNILFAHGKYMLLSSAGSGKLFGRQFLRRSFVNNLYNSTISSVISAYGDFIVTGYYTGGRAFAQFMGNASSSVNVEKQTKSLEKSINASLIHDKDSLSAHFGFDGKNGSYDSVYNKHNDIFVNIKTLGGIQDETGVINSTTKLSDLSIDLTSWRKSLNDSKNHTVIDLTEESLFPMSNFILEKNFQRRFDDTSKEILLPVTKLYTPSIMIARVLVKNSHSGENLYDVAAVLTTRQGDLIVFGNSNVSSDEELKQNEDDNVFTQKAQAIIERLSKQFSSDLEISHNAKKRINPQMRSPLCIVLEKFNEIGFYKYYNEETNIKYLYDPATKICFSFFADDGDESLLEVYGLSSWGANLPEKKISMATLANLYTIIGL